MPNRQKEKGNRFEYQVRDTFISEGIDCKRAYASDGRSLGLTEDVDVLAIHNDVKYPIQCKIRKRLSKVVKPNDNVFAQVIREDRGEPLAVLKLKDLVDLIAKL